MIALIKYRAGNIASVSNALERLGVDFYLAETANELDKADGVIFPGVGHAYSAMESLKEQGIAEWLKSTKKPVLGICVGMQLLFESSTEGDTEGLGVIPGKLLKFDASKEKVPHMGWNSIQKQAYHPLLKDINDEDFLYFVHSYYAPESDFSVATCDYITPFTAVVSKDNYFGVQFHPEKSGKLGAQILKNFVDYVYQS
ncbi:MAG: imidazole glycerol phosphate synthase subunit HisH [Balneolaceae bacterium]|nr:imidazole glycerol phosphate synthase subunit HisH [Balneolaceae bacterium]